MSLTLDTRRNIEFYRQKADPFKQEKDEDLMHYMLRAIKLLNKLKLKLDCVITTYTSQMPRCPLKETAHTPTPFFWNSGNSTIFLVPAKTELYIKCKDFLEYDKYTDDTI